MWPSTFIYETRPWLNNKSVIELTALLSNSTGHWDPLHSSDSHKHWQGIYSQADSNYQLSKIIRLPGLSHTVSTRSNNTGITSNRSSLTFFRIRINLKLAVKLLKFVYRNKQICYELFAKVQGYIQSQHGLDI